MLLHSAELRGVRALRMPSLETDAGGSLLGGQHDFVFAREPANRPVKERRSGFQFFLQLGHRHFTVCFQRVPDCTRHRANLFTHWDYPLLSKFRFSSTSIALTVTGTNSIFCFLCRDLDRTRRRGKAGLGAISA